MKMNRIHLALAGGLGCLLALLAFTARVQADLGAAEAPLNPEGGAFEINRDDQGWLWISDFDAEQVWGLDPQSGDYEIYDTSSLGGSPSDARHDGTSLWWADGNGGTLGRISTQDGSYTNWQVPGEVRFYGTALDGEGRFWALEHLRPYLYRLDSAAGQLCSYTLPEGGVSSYMVMDAVSVWLGDYHNGRILRLFFEDNHLDWWTLPTGSDPFGMGLDLDGSLWYADSNLHSLAYLDPDTGQLSSYALPYGDQPVMLTVQVGRVWYSQPWGGTLGVLYPEIAAAEVSTPTTGSTTLAPDCAAIEPVASGSLTIKVGSLAWSNTTYPTVVDSSGWQVFDLPEDALPWGLAASDSVWMVDSERRVLARIPTPIQVRACKLDDQDGDLLTTEDQVPVEGWRLYLNLDGERQEPGQLTGPDGCTTWNDLPAGAQLGVEEEIQEGWLALTPTQHDFGVAPEGAWYTHTFINRQGVYQVFLPLVVR